MFKAIFPILMLLISVSCQKANLQTSDKIVTTIGVEQPQTRVAIVPDELTEIWNSVWQQNDKIGGYTTASTSFEEFSMVGTLESQATTAYFSGNASTNSKMKFIYPYSADLKLSSDGVCSVNLERQTVDMSDPYTSLGASILYMASNEVEIDESGVAQSSITLQHLMSALEVTFTVGTTDDNYTYKIIGLRITSLDNDYISGFYTSGDLNLSLETPEFQNGAIGTLLIDVENSPEVVSGDQIVIPLIIAPTTLEYRSKYASVGATFSLHVSKVSLVTGVESEDCCEYTKVLSSSQVFTFGAGEYNTIDCSTITTDFGTVTTKWSEFF